MNRHWITAAAIPGALLLLAAPALAQKKVPGEKWRQTMSMEMAGMSMPARTVEMCAPVGKAQEAMSKPDQGNCAVSNAVQSGNKYSADIHCTGRDAMDGHVESEFDGKTMRSTMRMKNKDGEMTMKSESTKLGACEAVDYSDYKPPVVKAPTFDADAVCKAQVAELAKDPGSIGQRASLFVGTGSNCGNSPSLKEYCAMAQTHVGFASLAETERRMAGMIKASGATPAANDAQFAPLTASLGACKAGPADAVRKKLADTAVAQNAWEFLLGQDNDADFAYVVALGKRECGGRGGTSASNARFASLCASYGQMLANNDRPGVMSVYHGDCSGDCGTIRNNGGTRSSASTAGNAPNGDDKPKEDAKQKAKDALDKGKKALKGLFGGG
jgi:hypothetical protein